MTRRVNAREAVADIQAMMTEEGLMEKYGLSSEELTSLVHTLLAARFITEEPLNGSGPSGNKPQETQIRAEELGSEDSSPRGATSGTGRNEAKSFAHQHAATFPTVTNIVLLVVALVFAVVAAAVNVHRTKMAESLALAEQELVRLQVENFTLQQKGSVVAIQRELDKSQDMVRQLRGRVSNLEKNNNSLSHTTQKVQLEVKERNNEIVRLKADAKEQRERIEELDKEADKWCAEAKYWNEQFVALRQRNTQPAPPHNSAGPSQRKPNSRQKR